MAASEMSQVAVAVNRFGLGARPDEPLPTGDPRRWLLDQFARYEPAPPAWAALPPSATLIDNYVDAQKELRQADAGNAQDLRKKLRTQVQDTYRAAVNARVQAALTTPAPMAERLVHFWSNHFAVSVDKTPLAALAGAYEAEAIRPHVFGRFEDMLLAVERHPAMLLFLDQARSMGADSPAAMRAARPRGLNENLAREIMELHTLGVRTGYDQQDVTEFARALTGWSVSGVPGVPRGGGGAAGAFQYRPAMHEPGARQVLGQRYEQAGEAQAAAVLHHLAVQPATAHHIGPALRRRQPARSRGDAAVERLPAQRRRPADRVPRAHRIQRSLERAATQVQDTVGMGCVVVARLGLARSGRRADGALAHAERPAGLAAGLAGGLRRCCGKLACARRADAPRRDGAAPGRQGGAGRRARPRASALARRAGRRHGHRRRARRESRSRAVPVAGFARIPQEMNR